MPGPRFKMFVLSEFKQHKLLNQPPKNVYLHFYKKVQEKQLNDIKIVEPIFTIIDNKIRKINVNTQDPIEQKNIREQTILLTGIIQEIRESLYADNSKFLDSLAIVLKQTPF